MKSQLSARKFLFELQKRQFVHDENFHREIARLPVARRLTHMALHISKYFSRAVREEASAEPFEKNWLDTFIISTSVANILNVRLADLWGVGSELPEPHLKRWLATKLEGSRPILIEFADINDKLSSACEKLDHLEDHSYRPAIAECIARLSAISADQIYSRHGDLFDPVAARLHETKKKSIFFEG